MAKLFINFRLEFNAEETDPGCACSGCDDEGYGFGSHSGGGT